VTTSTHLPAKSELPVKGLHWEKKEVLVFVILLFLSKSFEKYYCKVTKDEVIYFKTFKKMFWVSKSMQYKNEFKIYCCILLDIFLSNFKILLISVAFVIQLLLYSVLRR